LNDEQPDITPPAGNLEKSDTSAAVPRAASNPEESATLSTPGIEQVAHTVRLPQDGVFDDGSESNTNRPAPRPRATWTDIAIVLFTGVLTGVSLWQGWQIREDAKQATISEQRQQRAYLFLSRFGVVDKLGVRYPDAVGYQLTLKNSGLTPAYNVSVWKSIKVLPADAHNLVIYPEEEKKPDPRFIVGAGEDVGVPVALTQPLTSAEKQAITSGIAELYLYGVVQYDDAFGVRRRTTFCLKRYSGGHQMTPCHEGNEAE
jgi:hypothetical protein